MEKMECSYPNSIPVDRVSRQAEGRIDKDMAPDIHECPNWIDEITGQLSGEDMNIGQATLRAGRHD